MSSSPLSAIINALTQVAAANYVGLAVTAMVVYEYLITLDREVAAVWKRKFAATSMLLLSVRWVMLLIQIIDWLPSTPGRCKPLGILEQVLIVIAYVQTALFSALRACAIWERNLTIFLVVICLGLVPAATNIFAITRGSYQYVGAPFYTCESAVSLSPKLDQIYVPGPQLSDSDGLAGTRIDMGEDIPDYQASMAARDTCVVLGLSSS
ncbi:hypothetical protein PsYK624_013680 [Phanerochaete sordida]|uniref:DUF6533 domain-containing protein n=1 Tax=Phanerochaete sordida TaxID=48140 RepID=A0A9P3FZR8_9APHY|nr:hypothetical protein PsYK624_013680 [Phanerochaete sordida]